MPHRSKLQIQMLRNYGIPCLPRLALHWLYTRLRFLAARLVQFPIHIRGRHAMRLGARLTTDRQSQLDAYPNESSRTVHVICNDVQLNDSVLISATDLMEIGDHTLIASHVFVTDHSHGVYDQQGVGSRPYVIPLEHSIVARPAHIGGKVLLGEQVRNLAGVTVGDGVVVGANSAGTINTRLRTVVTSNPARAIRGLNNRGVQWLWA